MATTDAGRNVEVLLKKAYSLTHRIHSAERSRPRSLANERLSMRLRDERDVITSGIIQLVEEATS